VVVVAYGAFSAYRLVHATRELQAGVATVGRVRGELSTANIETTPAGPNLQLAAAQFGEAHRAIHSSLLEPLRILPYVGRQLRSVDALSGAAATITGDGHESLTQVQGLFVAPHHTAEQRAALVRRLATVVSTLNQEVDRVDLGPSDALIPTLAKKRNIFVADLDQLHTGLVKGTAAVSAVADLLGSHHTYLLLTANNAEMRDGSGTFLQAGTLTTDGGRITLDGFQATAPLATTTPQVQVTGDLQARWGSTVPGGDYRVLGLSPQFELNAPVAAALWKHQTGQSVDGVVTIDDIALKDLLAVTGPVTAGGNTITTANLEQTLFVTQYQGVTGSASNEARREELGALGSAVFTALQKPGLSLAGAANALDAAVNGRHIMVWSANLASERDWQQAGVSGQLGPGDLLLGVSNEGGSKLDPYQDVSAHLTVEARGSDSLVTVTGQLTNNSPTNAGLPPYVIGGSSATPPYEYIGILSLDVPKYTGSFDVTGGTGLLASGSDGPSTVEAVQVKVPPGTSASVTWTFLLRGHHGTLRVDPSARVPPVSWSTPGVEFNDTTAHTVRW
jgi:hypothetical protein